MGDASRVHGVSNQDRRCACSSESLLCFELCNTPNLQNFSLPPDTGPIHLVAPLGALRSSSDEADESSSQSVTSTRLRASSLRLQHLQREKAASSLRRYTGPSLQLGVAMNQEQKNRFSALKDPRVCHLELQAPKKFFSAARSLGEQISTGHIHSLMLDVHSTTNLLSGGMPVADVFPCIDTLVLNVLADACPSVGSIISYGYMNFKHIPEFKLVLHSSLMTSNTPLETFASRSLGQAGRYRGDPSTVLLLAMAGAKPLMIATFPAGFRICHMQMK